MRPIDFTSKIYRISPIKNNNCLNIYDSIYNIILTKSQTEKVFIYYLHKNDINLIVKHIENPDYLRYDLTAHQQYIFNEIKKQNEQRGYICFKKHTNRVELILKQLQNILEGNLLYHKEEMKSWDGINYTCELIHVDKFNLDVFYNFFIEHLDTEIEYKQKIKDCIINSIKNVDNIIELIRIIQKIHLINPNDTIIVIENIKSVISHHLSIDDVASLLIKNFDLICIYPKIIEHAIQLVIEKDYDIFSQLEKIKNDEIELDFILNYEKMYSQLIDKIIGQIQQNWDESRYKYSVIVCIYEKNINIDIVKKLNIIFLELLKKNKLHNNKIIAIMYQRNILNNNMMDENRLAHFKSLYCRYYIINKLINSARNYFYNLLYLNKNYEMQNILGDEIITMGDSDGSIGREILEAIIAWKISLDEIYCDKLVELLELEYQALQKSDGLESFQQSEYVNILINQIVDNIIYSNSKINLIFIGDSVNDRFTNNKLAHMKLREGLSQLGVIYILGNHDSINVFQDTIDKTNKLLTISSQEKYLMKLQFGDFATKNILNDDLQSHIKKVFINCYYDSVNGAIYIHNGIKYNEDDKSIETSFGKFIISAYSNLNELIDVINSIEYQPNGTGFRPSDKENFMAIKELKQYYKLEDILIIHGHNGEYNRCYYNVINLNSRFEEKILPVCFLHRKK